MTEAESHSSCFGVGCFHFAPRSKTVSSFNLGEFIQELRASLESVPNISYVSVTGIDDDAYDVSFDMPENVPDIQLGPGFFPPLTNTKITFELYLPERIQQELVVGSIQGAGEKFQVTIHNTYDFPVAIVEPLDNPLFEYPSTLVQIVREFLEKEVNGTERSSVQFQSLGPSPFHADFFYTAQKTNEKKSPTCECNTAIGYDIIKFDIFYQDSWEASSFIFFHDLAEEFGYYYAVVQQRNQNLDRWLDVQENLEQLRLISRDGNKLKQLWNKLRLRNLLDQIYFGITDVEVSRVRVQSEFVRRQEIHESIFNEVFLDKFVGREINEVLDFPVRQVTTLVELFEGRRSETLQNLYLLLSAICGGVIGAVIAKALQDGASGI